MAFPKGMLHPGKGNSMCQSKNKKCRPYESLYNASKHRAENATNRRTFGRKWSLTYEDFLNFVKIKVCHYCGEGDLWPLPFGFFNEQGEYRFRSNLDRKDNNVDYTKENCVVCCPSCNEAKGCLLSYEEMIAVGLIRYRKRKP